MIETIETIENNENKEVFKRLIRGFEKLNVDPIYIIRNYEPVLVCNKKKMC